MIVRLGLILILSFSLVVLSAGSNFAQELKANADTSVSLEPEVQWLWGEVLAVNPQDKAIQVKYVDYDSDTEKEIIITADPQTTYENVKSLEQIQPQDTVSVDYVSAKDGSNLAKNISVEKSDNNPGGSNDAGSKGAILIK
jgi:FKBP-type peptidyl-prolyl cis-trans isomerase (trigger factor)